MAIHTMPELEKCKEGFSDAIAKLHLKLESCITYKEILPDGGFRRPIFLLKTSKQAAYVQGIIDSLSSIASEIEAFTGKKPRLQPPILKQNVSSCKVWENNAVSSSTDTTTREKIISRLKKNLHNAQKYTDTTNRLKAKELIEEITFFESEEEEVYRKRSIGNTDIVTGIVFRDERKDQRTRVTTGGLFIFGDDEREAELIKPNIDKTIDRRGRPSVFNHVNPIKFSGSINTVLYRESEVIKAKEKMGFSQDEARDKVLTQHTKTA